MFVSFKWRKPISYITSTPRTGERTRADLHDLKCNKFIRSRRLKATKTHARVKPFRPDLKDPIITEPLVDNNTEHLVPFLVACEYHFWHRKRFGRVQLENV